MWKCVLDSTGSGLDPVDMYTTCMPMVTILLKLWVGVMSWPSDQLTASYGTCSIESLGYKVQHHSVSAAKPKVFCMYQSNNLSVFPGHWLHLLHDVTSVESNDCSLSRSSAAPGHILVINTCDSSSMLKW